MLIWVLIEATIQKLLFFTDLFLLLCFKMSVKGHTLINLMCEVDIRRIPVTELASSLNPGFLHVFCVLLSGDVQCERLSGEEQGHSSCRHRCGVENIREQASAAAVLQPFN